MPTFAWWRERPEGTAGPAQASTTGRTGPRCSGSGRIMSRAVDGVR